MLSITMADKFAPPTHALIYFQTDCMQYNSMMLEIEKKEERNEYHNLTDDRYSTLSHGHLPQYEERKGSCIYGAPEVPSIFVLIMTQYQVILRLVFY